MEGTTDKLDLYSIPVFLVELLVLLGLGYAAHYLHFQLKPQPYLSGFYCDDVSLRHEYASSPITRQFEEPDNELVVLALLLAVPILVIIFCELVNSLFGALKFRRIHAMCKCCKLHSITRRTIRFAGAYILGFLFVMISCNLIAITTGHLKPYFAQECRLAYRDCPTTSASQLPATSAPSLQFGGATASGLSANKWTAPVGTTNQPASGGSVTADLPDNMATPAHPPSAPIMSQTNQSTVLPTPSRLVRDKRQATANLVDRRLVERKWIILEGVDLANLCEFSGDSVQTRRFDQLGMSWPSFPAAMVSYACFFIAIYLSFVGTARPFRLITCVLVLATLLLGLIFDVHVVKEHYSHWEDVLAGSALAFGITVFMLIVYLNKFRDSHFYQNQKVLLRQRSYASATSESNHYNGYSNEIALEQFNLDKTDEQAVGNNSGSQQNGDTSNANSMPNNDLAMRYFQIPRANYRGAPRPISTTTNHM